ncbi:MAG: hypothetical protein ABI451_13435, partial [Dokdonella sp.]
MGNTCKGFGKMGIFARTVFFSLLGVIPFGLAVLPASAVAQTYTYSIYVNSDARGGTGCTEGPVSGAEVRLRVTASGGMTPEVLSVTRAKCLSGSFGAETVIGGNYPVGINDGTAGSDVIELADDLSQLAAAGSPSLGLAVVATSATGNDYLLTTDGSAGGPAILFGLPAVPIPLLGIPALIGLAVLFLVIGGRVARRRALWRLLALIFMVSGVAVAANFVVDGQVGDWNGVPPIATDPAGDSTSGQSAIDLRALFAAIENGKVFFRIDVSNIQSEAPTITSAASTTFAIGAPGSFTVTATGVPVPALGMGCTPALPTGVTFTDNGDGTGTLA